MEKNIDCKGEVKPVALGLFLACVLVLTVINAEAIPLPSTTTLTSVSSTVPSTSTTQPLCGSAVCQADETCCVDSEGSWCVTSTTLETTTTLAQLAAAAAAAPAPCSVTSSRAACIASGTSATPPVTCYYWETFGYFGHCSACPPAGCGGKLGGEEQCEGLANDCGRSCYDAVTGGGCRAQVHTCSACPAAGCAGFTAGDCMRGARECGYPGSCMVNGNACVNVPDDE